MAPVFFCVTRFFFCVLHTKKPHVFLDFFLLHNSCDGIKATGGSNHPCRCFGILTDSIHEVVCEK